MKPWEKYSKVGTEENFGADILGLPQGMEQDLASGNEIQDDYSAPWEKYQAEEVAPVEQEIQPRQGDIGSQGQALAYGLNTAVPFGNVMSSGIGAGIAKTADLLGIVDDKRTFKELYDQATLDTKATQEAFPKTSLAGTIGGIGATLPLASAKVLAGARPTQGIRGLVNATPEALAKVGSFVRGGKTGQAGLLSKALRGGVTTAPISALYGAGEAEQGERLQGAKSGAGLGFGVGATLPLIGAGLTATYLGSKNVLKGLGARSVDELTNASQAIKDSSQKAYEAVREAGILIKPKALNQVAMNIEKDLLNDGKLNRRLHTKVMGVLRDFRKDAKTQSMDIAELDQWRQVFGDVASNFNDPAQARKARIAMSSLDNALDDLSDDQLGAVGTDAIKTLGFARGEWKKQAKFNTILEVIENSSGDGQKLRRDLEKLLTTKAGKKKIRSFTKDERAYLKEITTQTTGEGALKMLGKFGFDVGSARSVGNTALPAIGSGLAYGGSGVTGALAVPAIGTASRKAHQLIGRGKVEKLLEIIEQGGNVSKKQIMDLPPTDAKKMLELVRQQSINIKEQVQKPTRK